MDITKLRIRQKRDYEKHKDAYKRRANEWYRSFKERCTEEEMRARLDRGVEAKRKVREKYRSTKIALQNWLGGKCATCGIGDHRLLDFDHVDPSTKEIVISAKLGLGFWRLLPEVNKCQLLCANCHRLKTFY